MHLLLLIPFLLLSHQDFLILHNHVAVILLELLLPSPAHSVDQLGLYDPDDILEGRLRAQLKSELGLHLVDKDIGIILNFSLLRKRNFLLIFVKLLRIIFIHILVDFRVPPRVDYFAFLQADAIINQIQHFEVFQVEVLHIEDFIYFFIFYTEFEPVHCVSEARVAKGLFVLLLILFLRDGNCYNLRWLEVENTL